MADVKLSAECEAWILRQDDQFMRPAVEFLTQEEAAEYCDQPLEEASPGFYGRLSAPGYMDCTEWNGPHSSEVAALEALYDDFGDDGAEWPDGFPAPEFSEE